MQRIRTQAELDAALAAAEFLLFKHSHACPVSAAAFREYRHWAEAHPTAPTGWIDVIDERPLSQAVAARTGVTHESPQALRLRGGVVVWHASHGAITRASLAAAAAAPA